MYTLSPLTFFDDFMPSRERVLVISDSQYAEHKKSEAQKQIDVLQARADEYSKALATLTATIDGLKQEHGIAEPEIEAPN
jgi:peptidoglycan hydrolase CwlO-like protein